MRAKSSSIHFRLTSTTLLVLALFLGLTGYLLQTAQRHSLETAVESQLLGHVYALLGEAKESPEGLVQLPKQVSDPRLNQPDSGLYAELTGGGWSGGLAFRLSAGQSGPATAADEGRTTLFWSR